MSREYIFIDDSGDPGLKKSSSSHFIIAAILFLNEDKKQLVSDAIDLFRRNLGWNDLHEFKFHTTKKDIILSLIEFLKPFDFSAYAMVLDKTKMDPNDMPKNKSSLYYYVIKELLLKLKLTNPVITIDGRAGKQYANEIRTYLRQSLKENGASNTRIYLTDSKKNSLIQLADIVAGSVARSFDRDKTDAKIYRKALSDKIVDTYEIKI